MLKNIVFILWSFCFRLETEKSNADREIKNLKFQLEELKERNRRLTAMSNGQVRKNGWFEMLKYDETLFKF